MTTTKKAVDPNDPAPIACQKLIMEFSDSVYMRVGLGATRAPCPWPVRTREEMQRTRTLIYRLLLLTYAKHIHIRTRRAQASHAQTDSLQVQRALSAYILVSQCPSFTHGREKIM